MPSPTDYAWPMPVSLLNAAGSRSAMGAGRLRRVDAGLWVVRRMHSQDDLRAGMLVLHVLLLLLLLLPQLSMWYQLLPYSRSCGGTGSVAALLQGTRGLLRAGEQTVQAMAGAACEHALSFLLTANRAEQSE